MIKHVLVNLSNTQRIVLERVNIKNGDRVEIRKEYRKTSEGDWISSKGITIPVKNIPRLVTLLSKIYDNKGVDDGE